MATARIFEEPDGKYYICDDNAEILDARGRGHPTADMGYTHAVGSGTYWEGIRKLPQDVVA